MLFQMPENGHGQKACSGSETCTTLVKLATTVTVAAVNSNVQTALAITLPSAKAAPNGYLKKSTGGKGREKQFLYRGPQDCQCRGSKQVRSRELFSCCSGGHQEHAHTHSLSSCSDWPHMPTEKKLFITTRMSRLSSQMGMGMGGNWDKKSVICLSIHFHIS